MRKITYGLLFVIFFTAVLAGCSWTQKEAPFASWIKIENTKAENEKTIAARRISNTYLQNELNGEKLYGGKILKVHGTFVELNYNGRYYSVYIYSGGTDREMVECMFRKEHKDELANLKPDQQVFVKGEVGFDGRTYLKGSLLIK